MADHFDHRRFHRRMFTQEIRSLVVSGKDDRITIWQRVVQHREVLASPARPGTKPGRYDRRSLLQGTIRRAGKDHGQRHRAVVAWIEERYREVREIVLHFQRLVGEVQHAAATDVQPQRTAGRVFTNLLIVADKLQPHTVKVGDKQWVDRHLRQRLFAQLFLGDRQHAHQLIVQIDLELRLYRQQGWRRGVLQIQHGSGDHFIATHAKFNTAIRVHATQHHAARRRRDLRKRQFHVTGWAILRHNRRISSLNARHHLTHRLIFICLCRGGRRRGHGWLSVYQWLRCRRRIRHE